MMTKPNSAKFLRQRKFFLLLPLYVVPFVTLFFVLMGGGNSQASMMLNSATLSGLNMQLPDAHNAEHPRWTKLDFYKQADADSAKRKAMRARDPYYQLNEIKEKAMYSTTLLPVDTKQTADVAAARLTTQIHELNRQLKTPVEAKSPERKSPPSITPSPDVARLEAMLQAARSSSPSNDPEMEQLNHMLEKIMAIQHPEEVGKSSKDSVRQQGKVFNVDCPDSNMTGVWGDTGMIAASSNGFYSLDDVAPDNLVANSFAAVIAENQTLVSGAIIKLRLTQDLEVNHHIVAADQLIYGLAHLNGQRLEVSINTIRIGQQLLPVKLSAYDLDGLAGIAIPGAITRDVLKQEAGQSMQNIGLLSVDPSVGAQAASAGIQAAKTLLRKKIQLTKVSVPSGYQVLLKNDERLR